MQASNWFWLVPHDQNLLLTPNLHFPRLLAPRRPPRVQYSFWLTMFVHGSDTEDRSCCPVEEEFSPRLDPLLLAEPAVSAATAL